MAPKRAMKKATAVQDDEPALQVTPKKVPKTTAPKRVKKAAAAIKESAPVAPIAAEGTSKKGKKRTAGGKPDLSGILSPMVRKMSQKIKKQVAAAPPAIEPMEPESAKKPKKENKTQELLNVIRRTMRSVPFKGCAVAGVRLHPAVLTSFDSEGFPSMRTVIPHEIQENLMDVRVRTNLDSRKVQEIQKNKRISLHYQDQRGRGGWVTLKGEAKVDLNGSKGDLVEIVLKPERCECVSYIEGPTSADAGEGWKPAILVRPSGGDAWRRTQ